MVKVLITGASKGLGAALVMEFNARGASVWGVARSEKPAIHPDADGRFRYSMCDVRNQDGVKKAVKEMISTGFIPDVVIFNAGAASDDVDESGGEFDMTRFRENYDANLFGAVAWIEELLPLFLKRELPSSRGSGVFAAISSLSVYRENHRNRMGYSSSKIALSKAFENFRMQYHGTGVRFVAFHPGRMSEAGSFIGTTYAKAARTIAENVLSSNPPASVDFPRLQYILTRILRFVPDGLFYRFIFK